MRVFIAIVLGLMLSGCAGVNYSFRGGEVPGETFSVESFKNTAALVNPNLTITLQDELQQKFANESNLKYTDLQGDAHFTGIIKRYSISPVQGTGDELVSLNRLTISISVTYTNDVSDKANFENKTFTAFEDFESSEDFSSLEADLIATISEKLVSLVYNEVLVDW